MSAFSDRTDRDAKLRLFRKPQQLSHTVNVACDGRAGEVAKAPALQESRQNHTSAASGVAYADARGAIDLLNWTEVGPKSYQATPCGSLLQLGRPHLDGRSRLSFQPTPDGSSGK